VGFRLKSGQAVSNEVRRIVLQQLDRAASELTSIGDPESDESIHDARRRVKKIRAIIRLVRPVLGKAERIDPNMKKVSKLLAPVADGQGVIDTLNQLLRRYRTVLPRKTAAAIRSDLVARGRRIDMEAQRNRVLQEARKTLKAERERVKRWRLPVDGFRAVAPGLKNSVKSARTAMMDAWLHPTAERHHTWRRHVKNHWFHVRLLSARCGDQLQPYQRQLEALDGILGEFHNLVLLHEVLVSDSSLSGSEIARCIRIVDRYQHELRRNAQVLGIRIYSETPRRFVRRVKDLWRSNGPS
jgi:CHAD domain-containing protein